MSIEKVRAYFEARGRGGDILEFSQSSATVELAAQAVGVIPARIAKTLSFRPVSYTHLITLSRIGLYAPSSRSSYVLMISPMVKKSDPFAFSRTSASRCGSGASRCSRSTNAL